MKHGPGYSRNIGKSKLTYKTPFSIPEFDTTVLQHVHGRDLIEFYLRLFIVRVNREDLIQSFW